MHGGCSRNQSSGDSDAHLSNMQLANPYLVFCEDGHVLLAFVSDRDLFSSLMSACRFRR
jgi:hypothetical protein